ncbi:hypothetical protein B0H10DRAFT_2000198 [Mycena sp. CBHHK59/15]|nr:hypothetical protein B0H10DRAFT_2000198 [Mycena sp. CBHHK59/15]
MLALYMYTGIIPGNRGSLFGLCGVMLPIYLRTCPTGAVSTCGPVSVGRNINSKRLLCV